MAAQSPALLMAPALSPKTFHRRKLPAPAIEFSSKEGQRLFAQALATGTMGGFFRLIEQFHTQDEPAFCGLGTLTMVLNALNVDPGKTWKGPWRWFHEEMLDCCEPIDQIKQTGIIWPKWLCLARCNGAYVDARRADEPDGTLEHFRRLVKQATTQDIGCAAEETAGSLKVLVCSYSRKQFLQTGDGHYSPIGGYHSEKDLVLILDVARFKHPPHWVPLEEMYKSMQRQDPDTKRSRGFAVLSSSHVDSAWLSLIAKCSLAADNARGESATIAEVQSAFVRTVGCACCADGGAAAACEALRAAVEFCSSPEMPVTVVAHDACRHERTKGCCGGEAESRRRELEGDELEREERETQARLDVFNGLREVADSLDRCLVHENGGAAGTRDCCFCLGKAPLRTPSAAGAQIGAEEMTAQERKVAQVLAVPMCMWEDALAGTDGWPLIEGLLKKENLPAGMQREVEALRAQFSDLLTRGGQQGGCRC
mmetsp:Transcript_29914/g.95638  ORF Transcript_29914/g.95638 Transcript_29914/m.95638 type:complete len:482 (-) Transcript_29914:54-1499(-)